MKSQELNKLSTRYSCTYTTIKSTYFGRLPNGMEIWRKESFVSEAKLLLNNRK